MNTATAIAHPNIALVKYWGKRDIPLNLPSVPSLSLTLSRFRTETTVYWGTETDTLWLDGRLENSPFKQRAFRHLDRIDPSRPPCRIETTNNFPTAAGLASSSSGFAALTLAGLAAAGREVSRTEASVLARQGSGSACRSLWGGFVQWDLGHHPDGSDSHGHPIAPPEHWDVSMVIAVVSDAKKAIGSTKAMMRTVETSSMFDVFQRGALTDVDTARQAVLSRDLEALGRVMESSTFKMHATMHTASPPILYWHPQTVACIHAVHRLRADGISAWLTMDAGPNVKVLCETENAPRVQSELSEHVSTTHILAAGPDAQVRLHG